MNIGKPPVAKKNVSFSTQKDTIHVISNHADRRDLVWFSADEMYDTKADATQLAEALETIGLSGSHEDWRGLESRGPEGRWMAYKARLDISNAVLDAQDQRLDAILLAKASREISADSVAQAHERALKDAIDAKEYFKGVHHKLQRKPNRRRSLQHTQAPKGSKQYQQKKPVRTNRRGSMQTTSQKTRVLRMAFDYSDTHGQRP